MSKPTDGDVPIQRLDRILATMSLGLLVLSVACFFAIMIGSANGADFHSGVWPAVSFVVYFAPILAFIMMLTVIIRAFVRRARANRAR
jgi:FtsH-binding integral membrane protein